MNGVTTHAWAKQLKSSYIVSGAEVISEGHSGLRDVAVANGIFVDNGSFQRIDCSGKKLTPGLIDIHIHGICGKDFLEYDSLRKAQEILPQYGVTSFLPSIGSSSLSVYTTLPSLPSDSGAIPLGWHLEGPFLNPLYAGAHDPQWLLTECDERFWATVCEKGSIAMITLAPEVIGSYVLMKLAQRLKIAVSCGHCNPTKEELFRAKELGVSCVTHLFNGMAPFHHRNDSLIGAVLGDRMFLFSLICDGIHVNSQTIRIAHACFASGCILTSDCSPFLCSEDRTGMFLGSSVHMEGEKVLLENNRLAGSIVPLDEQMRRYIAMTGSSFAEAIDAASMRPAQVLGLDHRKGAIKLGYDADFVIWDGDQVWMTFVNGKPVFCRETL